MMHERGEPEPLAFRVRPSLNECFDSWMDRLVARHDTTRKALFRHLDVDPRLADHDLMRGKASVPVRLHASFDRLIGQLCWAVEIEPEVVMETFVSLPTHWLLPPALRRFGCAQCWREALAVNKPLVVKKEWILCASWWCHDHGLPLSRKPESDPASRADLRSRQLTHLETDARDLARSTKPTKRLIAANKVGITYLLDGFDGLFPRRRRVYFESMVANGFHLSSARIRLMALRHSPNAEPARRFSEFVVLSRAEMRRSGQGFFERKQPPVEGFDSIVVVAGSRLESAAHWQVDYLELLSAYVQVAPQLKRGGKPRASCPDWVDPHDIRAHHGQMASDEASNLRDFG